MSKETNNWMWFGRFGCLIVVMGMVIVVTNFEQSLVGKSREHEFGSDAGPELEREAQEIVSLCTKMDLGILVLGNLIWGFGDLFGKLSF